MAVGNAMEGLKTSTYRTTAVKKFIYSSTNSSQYMRWASGWVERELRTFGFLERYPTHRYIFTCPAETPAPSRLSYESGQQSATEKLNSKFKPASLDQEKTAGISGFSSNSSEAATKQASGSPLGSFDKMPSGTVYPLGYSSNELTRRMNIMTSF